MGPLDHELTPEEAAKGRREAEENNRARVELKKSLNDGEMTFFALLEQGARGNDDVIAGRLNVGEVVDSIKGVGDVKKGTILTAANVPPAAQLNSLNTVERAQLCKAVQDEGFDSGYNGGLW